MFGRCPKPHERFLTRVTQGTAEFVETAKETGTDREPTRLCQTGL